MGKDLDRRQPTATGLARASTVDPGHAADIEAVTFTAAAVHFASLPTAFRAAQPSPATQPGQGLVVTAQPRKSSALELARKVTRLRPASDAARLATVVIASGARLLPGARRVSGRTVQRQIGWQATPTAIVVVNVDRELVQQPDRRYAPSGPWMVEERITYPCAAGIAEKREGEVAFDDASATSAGAEPAAGEAPAAQAGADPFAEGKQALAFLPRPVRSSVLARIPVPTLFDGSVLQYGPPGGGPALRQEVSLIRMDETSAVVVHAVRPVGARTWKVTQAVYALGAPLVERA